MQESCGEFVLVDADPGVDALRALAQKDRAVAVSALQLSRVPLGAWGGDARYRGLMAALPRFSALTTLRASECGLWEWHIHALLHAARALTRLRELSLSGNEGVTDRVLGCVDWQLPSVQHVALMRTPLTDAALPHVARIFCCAAALHLAQTAVRGCGLRALIEGSGELRVLGLDRTRLDDAGMSEIRAAVAERDAPLEVRMRGVGEQTAAWLPLLELAAQPSVRKRLVLRHDLQQCDFGAAGRPSAAPGRARMHERVQVHVHVNGCASLVVELPEVPGARSIDHVAAEALCEFNLFCLGDDDDAVAKPRRALYREAFAPLASARDLFGHQHHCECVYTSWISDASGEERIDLNVRHRLIGPGQPDRALHVHVGVTR